MKKKNYRFILIEFNEVAPIEKTSCQYQSNFNEIIHFVATEFQNKNELVKYLPGNLVNQLNIV